MEYILEPWVHTVFFATPAIDSFNPNKPNCQHRNVYNCVCGCVSPKIRRKKIPTAITDWWSLSIYLIFMFCALFFTNDIMKSLAQWPNGYGYGDNKLIWLLYNGMVLPLSLFCLLYHMRVYALHSRLVGWLVNRSVTAMHVNNSIATKKGQQKKPN